MAKPFPPPAIEALESRRMLARTLTVYANSETGPGSLYSALQAADAGDTIDLRGVSGIIPLYTTLEIDKSVTLIGPGSATLAIAPPGRGIAIAAGLDVRLSGFRLDGLTTGGNGGGIFVAGDIDTVGARLTLDDVDISHCTADELGGGLSANYTAVALTRCRFSGNTAAWTRDAMGGGVYINGGSLTAADCTFDANTAHATGAGLDNRDDVTAIGGGVALMNAKDSAFTNCTFTQNAATADKNTSGSAAGYGGAIGLFADGNFTLANCTISGNAAGGSGAAGFGGGFDIFSFGPRDVTRVDTLKMTNNVIAGNTASAAPDAFGLAVASPAKIVCKNNFVGVVDGSGVYVAVRGNVGGTAAHPLDARLGALADNGGPVPTMLPQADSPLLGLANAVETTRRDARGYPRSPSFDVGAVERQANYSPAVATSPDGTAVADIPYASAVSATDVDGDAITFSLVNAPAWLTVEDHGDGTATLAGTPGVSDAGATTVTLRASDGQQSWDEPFALDVAVTPVRLNEAGLLRVAGTDAAETIHVWQPKGGGGAVRVAIGKRIRNFPASAVTAIQVFSRGGDDVVTGNCVDFGIYLNGGDGRDTVTGGEASDSLSGGAGDDVVYGLGGKDWIDGNAGRDRLLAGAGDDRVYGGAGRDTIDGGAGRDVLYGEAGGDTFLTNDRARDRIFGGDGGNVVDGDVKDILYDATAIV